MKKFPTLAASIAAAFVAAALPSFADESLPTRIVQDAGRLLEIVDLSESDAAVRGVLLNRSDDTIKDMRISVSHNFLWTNDHNPGPDDPSRATIVTLDQTVPPRGSVPFTISFDPLPVRRDGHFMTETQVVSFVSWTFPRGGQSSAAPVQRAVD